MGVGGGGGAGVVGGGRAAARALRLLFLLVMALAAVEYLSFSIFATSPLRTYIYSPLYDSTLPTTINRDKEKLLTRPNAINRSIQNAEIEIVPLQTTVTIQKESVEIPSATIPKTVSEKETKMNNIENKEMNNTKNLSEATAESNNTIEPVGTIAPKETTTLITKVVDNVKTIVSSTEASNVTSDSAVHYCELPPDLGPREVDKTEIDLKSIENMFPELSPGGWYKPKNCTAQHKVAIIIPFRDRQQHLAIFLKNMHPFLMKQQLDYAIFVIEQHDNKPTSGNFNRAKLFNVGFVEANRAREGGWDCFIFHDVDLLPLDERNLYTCPRQPRHMSASIDKHGFKLMYQTLFGGVSALTREQFFKVNGFSNKYWGWGGEDDDMSIRVKKMNYHISRYKMSIARYTMLDHESQAANPKRYKLLSQVDKNFKKDGLSSLNYELLTLVKHRLFTLVTVNIDENS